MEEDENQALFDVLMLGDFEELGGFDDDDEEPMMKVPTTVDEGSSGGDGGDEPMMMVPTTVDEGSSGVDDGDEPMVPTTVDEESSGGDDGDEPMTMVLTTVDEGSSGVDDGDEPMVPTTVDEGSSGDATAVVGNIDSVEGGGEEEEEELLALALLAEDHAGGELAGAHALERLLAALYEANAEGLEELLEVAVEPLNEESRRAVVESLESLRRDRLLPFSKDGELLSCLGDCKRACISKLFVEDLSSMLLQRKTARWWADAARSKFAANDAVAASSQWGGQGGGKQAHARQTAYAKPPRTGAEAAKGPARLATASNHAGANEVLGARRRRGAEQGGGEEDGCDGEGDGPGPPKRPREGHPEEPSTQQNLPRSLAEARKGREKYAVDVAMQLRKVPEGEKKPRCCWRAVCYMTSTSLDYWYDTPNGQDGQTRLELLELYSYRRRDRDRAGMSSLEELKSLECGCFNNCQDLLSTAVLTARFEELCNCESIKDENVVVSRLLVDDLGQRTGVCLPFLDRWLLFPSDRARKLLDLMATALEHGADLRDGYVFMEPEVDGDIDSELVVLRQGSWNKLPEALFKRIADAYHLYSRPLPDQPFARLTQSDVNSLARLHAKAMELSPELRGVSISTFRRAIAEINKRER
jgi:hypothetical protein